MDKAGDKLKTSKAVGSSLRMHGPAIRGEADGLNAIFPGLHAKLEATGKRRKQSIAKVTQSEITRAIKASVKAGLAVSSTRIGADGSITVHHGGTDEEPPSEYDRWKARRDARPS